MQTQLLTTDEAAEFLRVSSTSLERWRCAGDGPRFRRLARGRSARVVYDCQDLLDWLETRSFGSTTEADVADRVSRYKGVTR